MINTTYMEHRTKTTRLVSRGYWKGFLMGFWTASVIAGYICWWTLG